MDLSSMWSSKRKRWWLVLTAPRFGKVSIEALPSLPEQPTINDLFPEFLKIYGSPAWDEYVLLDDELRMFHQYAKNFDDLILDPARVAPTALHAWGNQTRPCACGCRPPFSHRRLSERGLFGALVREQTPDGPMIRHVTAIEVALLNGYPMSHGDHPGRLLLAGVGQLASPVHSALVFACLHRQFRAGSFDVVKPIEAREAIAAICNDVLTLNKWFGRSKSASMTMFEERLSDLLGFPIGCHYTESRPSCGEPSGEGHGAQAPVTIDEVWECPFLDCPLKDNQIEPVVPEVADRTLFAEVISPTVKYSILPLPDHHFQATGAISGFRMSKRKLQDPAPTPVPRSGDSSELQSASVIPIPREPISQDGVSHAQVLKPFVRASAPEEFVDSSIGIIRVCDNSVQAIKTKGTISVASFLRAETAISGCRGQVFDILGCRLTDEALLDPGSFYVYTESDQIPEAMTSRITWLSANGARVAVDEMEFYIRTVSTTFKMPWVPPTIIEDLASMPTISAAWLSEVSGALDESGIVSAILANGHWMPVIVHQAPHGKTRFIVTQAGASLWPSLFDQQTRVEHFMHVSAMGQEFPLDCGFQTFMWLTARAADSEFDPADSSKAIQMRCNFVLAVIGRDDHFRHRDWLLGSGSEVQIALAGVLREHAVPEAKVIERANMLISQLGEAKLHDMFKSKNPWKFLKQVCNNHKPKLQIVLEDELQAAIGERARSVAPVGRKSDKRKKGKQAPELTSIHPADIAIPPGVFRQQNGGELPQLKINEISPTAAGVVVGHEEDLGPYIGKPGLSSQGLALLVISPSKYLLDKFGELIRFPVVCVQTGEPMLVSALLLQKGAILVERNVPDQPLRIQEVSNVVVKVAMFRDECPTPWEKIIAAPVKHLLDLFPQLMTCREPSCVCPKFHPASREESDMIMDVWNRDFISLKFHREAPNSADVFMCCIRFRTSAIESVLKQSGSHGCYIEIRAPDGKRDDVNHYTVWLPRKSLREAQAEQAAVKEPSAIIRVGHRYGLRVSAGDAEAVHATVRQEQAVMLGPNKQTWCMGPLPWGSSKQSVQKIIDEWGWKARALHTTGKAPDGSGLLWSLHAAGLPPATVYSLSHGDVLLTRVDLPQAVASSPAPVLVASKRTRDSLSAGAQDPLQVHDPWAQSSKPPPAETRYVTQAHLDAFAATLEAKVSVRASESSDDVSMDMDVTTRVEQLEMQVQQLTQAQNRQTAETQAIATQVSSLTSKVEATARSVENAVEAKLTHHLQELDNMLSKRLRCTTVTPDSKE